jgi:hypothetical protein
MTNGSSETPSDLVQVFLEQRGSLTFLSATDPFESLLKPTDLFSEKKKCIEMLKIHKVRFIEVIKQANTSTTQCDTGYQPFASPFLCFTKK